MERTAEAYRALQEDLEDYFLRVAKFFENQIEGSTWHRDLVDRMGHGIPAASESLQRA